MVDVTHTVLLRGQLVLLPFMLFKVDMKNIHVSLGIWVEFKNAN